jgi:hypothetical protein
MADVPAANHPMDEPVKSRKVNETRMQVLRSGRSTHALLSSWGIQNETLKEQITTKNWTNYASNHSKTGGHP